MDWEDDDWEPPPLKPEASPFEDEDADLKTPKPEEKSCIADRKIQKKRFAPLGKKKRKALEKARKQQQISAPSILPQTEEERRRLAQIQRASEEQLIFDLFGS